MEHTSHWGNIGTFRTADNLICGHQGINFNSTQHPNIYRIKCIQRLDLKEGDKLHRPSKISSACSEHALVRAIPPQGTDLQSNQHKRNTTTSGITDAITQSLRPPILLQQAPLERFRSIKSNDRLSLLKRGQETRGNNHKRRQRSRKDKIVATHQVQARNSSINSFNFIILPRPSLRWRAKRTPPPIDPTRNSQSRFPLLFN
jgi:hypothetical protein